jgi:hypothetical protein
VRIQITISILCGFLLAIGYATALTQPTDRDLDGIDGLVKRIDEEVAETKMQAGKPIEGSRRRYRSVTYDRQGRMTRRWMNVTGSSSTDETCSYDKRGNRHVRYSIFNPLIKSTPSDKEELALHVLQFNSGEDALYEDVYVGDEPSPKALTQRYEYRLDKLGRLAEKILYTLKGGVAVRDIYVYGIDRLPLERQLYSFGNPKAQIIKYAYTLDAQGNWIKRVEENTLANQDRTQRIKVTYRYISYY